MNEQPQTPIPKHKDQEAIEAAVAANINALSASALSAAIGRLTVLKATMVTTPQGKEKMVYQPISDDDEIAKAITWINDRAQPASSSESSQVPLTQSALSNSAYYIIQQSEPDIRALDLLLNRRLGKVTDNINLNQNLSINDIAIAAATSRRRTQEEQTTSRMDEKYGALGIPSAFFPSAS